MTDFAALFPGKSRLMSTLLPADTRPPPPETQPRYLPHSRSDRPQMHRPYRRPRTQDWKTTPAPAPGWMAENSAAPACGTMSWAASTSWNRLANVSDAKWSGTIPHLLSGVCLFAMIKNWSASICQRTRANNPTRTKTNFLLFLIKERSFV